MYTGFPKERLFSYLNMQWLGISTVDKEGESLAPRGIFAEIAGLQQEDCGICISLFCKQQRILSHWSPERGTVTSLFYSVMLYLSCKKRVKFPGQKCAEAKSLAKPEQALWGVETLTNESGELQLAPTGVAWTSSLPHLQQGTAPFLPPLRPESQLPAHRHPEPAPKTAASWQGRVRKLEGQFEGCRACGKSGREQLQCHPLKGWKSTETTQGAPAEAAPWNSSFFCQVTGTGSKGKGKLKRVLPLVGCFLPPGLCSHHHNLSCSQSYSGPVPF